MIVIKERTRATELTLKQKKMECYKLQKELLKFMIKGVYLKYVINIYGLKKYMHKRYKEDAIYDINIVRQSL